MRVRTPCASSLDLRVPFWDRAGVHHGVDICVSYDRVYALDETEQLQCPAGSPLGAGLGVSTRILGAQLAIEPILD